ncbi:alpha/beta fold hydrolase [Gulosibacter faecalis]|jgi:pimeloyl-ACP methyl ester carboxylesterase|uniref:Alpha/beta fold hydrolase n=1 Tax=Gulosibacter faecalis TaxID=272240 RepID=A0ABW5UUW9_9MICO|nr:alpha/beta hydrolase [Gulosibacter faecalis]
MTTPVVLLHGVGLNRSMWDSVRVRLAADGIEPAIALDLPGHGAEPPLVGPATLAELADDVRRRLPDGPVHLVGFSLGALIAQQLAATVPDRVRTLTCVNAVCDRSEAEADAVLGRLETARHDFAAAAERAIDRWYPDDSGVTDEERERTRAMLLANDLGSYLVAYEVFATGDRQVAPLLPDIAAPTLAITGELDPGSTPAMTRRLAERIHDARAEIVPGARHMLPIEREDAFVEALELHLRSAEGDPHDSAVR